MRSVLLKIAPGGWGGARSTRPCHSSLLTRSRTGVDLNFRLADMETILRRFRKFPVDRFGRAQQKIRVVSFQLRGVQKKAPPQPRPRVAVVEAEHVAADVAQRLLAPGVVDHL